MGHTGTFLKGSRNQLDPVCKKLTEFFNISSTSNDAEKFASFNCQYVKKNVSF